VVMPTEAGIWLGMLVKWYPKMQRRMFDMKDAPEYTVSFVNV
jgi:hypothetical protein